MLEQTYTISEVAEAARKPIPFIRRLIDAGELKAVRVGIQLRVTRSAWQNFLERNVRQGPAEVRNPHRRGRGRRKA